MYLPVEPPPTDYHDVQPGDCCFCSETIYKKDGRIDLRSDWHKVCLETHRLIYSVEATRKAVWQRDRGHCQRCERKFGLRGWGVAYIEEPQPDNLYYWTLDNLETICWGCQKADVGSPLNLRDVARTEQKRHMKKTGTRPKKGRTKPRT